MTYADATEDVSLLRGLAGHELHQPMRRRHLQQGGRAVGEAADGREVHEDRDSTRRQRKEEAMM